MNKDNSTLNLRMTVYASLFTALIIIGGYISFPIPFSPVPIVLSDFFVLLAGLFLGLSWGVTAVGMFLFLGLIGLPVFAGGKAGLAVLIGPTGGFLIGFLLAVAVIGMIAGKGKSFLVKDLVALIVGTIVIYGIGVPWLKLVLKVTWEKALALGMIPFVPGIIVKIIAALVLIRIIRPVFQIKDFHN